MKKLLIIVMLLITAALFAQQRALPGAISGENTEANVGFHGFTWGTSIQDFTAKMGRPKYTDEINGLQSLVYDNLVVSGYQAFAVVYFSRNGLEGGTYYFNTFSYEELIQCYKDVQKELQGQYGETQIYDIIYREMAPYQSAWNLASGFIVLKIDTRKSDPVTLWFSSPELTSRFTGS